VKGVAFEEEARAIATSTVGPSRNAPGLEENESVKANVWL